MYGSIDSKWSFIIPFALRQCRDYFDCVGSGGSFKGHCLLPWLELPADRAFMNGVASIATLDALVFSSSIVLNFLWNFDEGGRLLQLGIVVSVVTA